MMSNRQRYYELNCQRVTFSMPQMIIDTIDNLRGDTTRSRFICRILENKLNVDLSVKNSDGEVLENRPHQELSNVSDNAVTKTTDYVL